MDAKARYDRIVDYLKRNDNADVSTLSDVFQVSEMTIRRDLDRLEKENILIRVHGGARLITRNMYEPPLDARLKDHAEEKRKIGKYAASLVEEGDAVALDDSSTTYAMIPYIHVPATIITNHINVATALSENDQIKVILLGGEMRKQSMSMIGKEMENMLQRYHVDKAFLSAKALDLSNGIYDASTEEGNTKQAFMKSSQKTYFLFDHTKLNTQAFYKVCDVKEVTAILMDEFDGGFDDQEYLRKYCNENGVQLELI